MKITLGKGTEEERKIDVISHLSAKFGDRTVLIHETSEGYGMIVQNDPGSGRHPRNEMYLSTRSLLGLLTVVNTFFTLKGVDLGEMLKAKCGERNLK